MASNAGDARASFVSKLVTDPKQPPNTLLLTGFLGASSEEGYRRLYFDPQLADYVEIPNDAILHEQDVPREQSPLGSSYVWVKRDAELIHGPIGPNRLKAKFLEGRLAQEQGPEAAPFTVLPRLCTDAGPRCTDPTSIGPACHPTTPAAGCPPRTSVQAGCPIPTSIQAGCPAPTSLQAGCHPTKIGPACHPTVAEPQCPFPTEICTHVANCQTSAAHCPTSVFSCNTSVAHCAAAAPASPFTVVGCATQVPHCLPPTVIAVQCPTQFPQHCPTQAPQLCPTHIPQLCPTHFPQFCPTLSPNLCPVTHSPIQCGLTQGGPACFPATGVANCAPSLAGCPSGVACNPGFPGQPGGGGL